MEQSKEPPKQVIVDLEQLNDAMHFALESLQPRTGKVFTSLLSQSIKGDYVEPEDTKEQEHLMYSQENQAPDITQEEYEERQRQTENARRRQERQINAVEVGDAVWADMV